MFWAGSKMKEKEKKTGRGKRKEKVFSAKKFGRFYRSREELGLTDVKERQDE